MSIISASRHALLLSAFGLLLTACSQSKAQEAAKQNAKSTPGSVKPDARQTKATPAPAAVTGSTKLDVAAIAAEIKQSGYSATIARLRKAQPGPSQTIQALEQTRSYFEQDVDQLWFQLQSHTRLKGSEKFQSELLRQRPPGTLTALTSGLEPVQSSVVYGFHLHELKVPPPRRAYVTAMQISGDKQTLLIGVENGIYSFDLQKRELAGSQKLPPVGWPLQFISHDQGDVCLAIKRRDPQAMPGDLSLESVRLYRCRDGSRIVDVIGAKESRLMMPDFGGSLSPDGRFLAVQTGSPTGVFLVSTETGKVVRTIEPKTDVAKFRREVGLTAFVDEGRQLMTADEESMVRFFTVNDGEESEPPAKILVDGYPPSILALNAAKTRLLLATFRRDNKAERPSASRLLIWDIAEREVTASMEFMPELINCAAFLGNDTVAAGTATGKVVFWDGKPETTARLLKVQSTHIARIAPGPDHQHVFVLDHFNCVRMVDLKSQASPSEELPPEPLPLAGSRDGQREALLGEAHFLIRNTKNQTVEHTLPLKSVAPIGSIWTAALDMSDGTVCLGGDGAVAHWKPGTPEAKLIQLEHGGLFSQIPPKQEQALRRSREIQLQRNPNIPVSPVDIPADNTRVVCSADGQFAAMWNVSHIGILDTKTGKLSHTIERPGEYMTREYGLFSGNRLAINYRGAKGSSVRIIDLAQGTESATYVYGLQWTGTAFSSATDTIFATTLPDNDGRVLPVITVIDLKDGKTTNLPVPSPQFGQIVACNQQGTQVLTLNLQLGIQVWNYPAWTLHRRFELGINAFEAKSKGLALEVNQRLTGGTFSQHFFRYE